MATGIDVVGLVLAVLPLFISAAEHHKDSFDFVKRAIHKSKLAEQYCDELTQQHTLLTLYIKGVVGRTSLSPKVQLALIEDLTGDEWRRADVVKQLQAELGDAYKPFLDIVSKVCKVLAKQIKSVSGSELEDDEVVRQLRNLCLEQTKSSTVQDKAQVLGRIKFSWKTSKTERDLSELREYNSMLSKLSIAADRAKSFEKKQHARRAHSAFEHREQIQKLFAVMQNACKFQSSAQRNIGLQLRRHDAVSENKAELEFETVLTLSQDVILEVSVKIENSEADEPQKKKVRIASLGKCSDAKTSGTKQKLKILGDICEEVTLAHSCQSCLQIVVDKHEKVYCQPKLMPATWTQTTPQEVTSLTTMMSSLKTYDQKKWLHKDKAILAIILAYSLLQLHGSPWSQAKWTADDITFLGSPQISPLQNERDLQYHLRQPYTRAQVSTTTAASQSARGARTLVPPSARLSRQTAQLHALGIILLELYLGQSIKPDAEAQGTTDYRSVALDLLAEHADDMNMTTEYLLAVRFCLSPNPNPFSRSFSFEDEGFREIYYTEVIENLEDNLSSRFEVNGNDLRFG